MHTTLQVLVDGSKQTPPSTYSREKGHNFVKYELSGLFVALVPLVGIWINLQVSINIAITCAYTSDWQQLWLHLFGVTN